MKVVYLSASGQMGGSERCLVDMLASIKCREPGWSLHLIVAEDGPLVLKAKALGVPVTVLPFPGSLSRLGDAGLSNQKRTRAGRLVMLSRMIYAAAPVFSYVRGLRKELRRLDPDVIHSNGLKMHALSCWSTARRKLAIIWHVHDYVSTRPVMAKLLRREARRCAAVVANSESVAEDFRKVCGSLTAIHCVYNGVDLDTFTPKGSKLDLDGLSGLEHANGDTVRVGLVATLSRWKGHEIFLRSLAMLPSDLPVRGYVVGGAIYQTEGSQYGLSELSDLAARLGVRERVGFTGHVEDTASAMRALDIVVHASTRPEPFGLVIAEGMACGRSVIASRTGGAREVIGTDESVLSHTPGDAESLARQIGLLVEDAPLRERLGQRARRAAEARFDRSRLATELIPIYLKAVGAA